MERLEQIIKLYGDIDDKYKELLDLDTYLPKTNIEALKKLSVIIANDLKLSEFKAKDSDKSLRECITNKAQKIFNQIMKQEIPNEFVIFQKDKSIISVMSPTGQIIRLDELSDKACGGRFFALYDVLLPQNIIEPFEIKTK